jgi:hypothetical protein
MFLKRLAANSEQIRQKKSIKYVAFEYFPVKSLLTISVMSVFFGKMSLIILAFLALISDSRKYALRERWSQRRAPRRNLFMLRAETRPAGNNRYCFRTSNSTALQWEAAHYRVFP